MKFYNSMYYAKPEESKFFSKLKKEGVLEEGFKCYKVIFSENSSLKIISIYRNENTNIVFVNNKHRVNDLNKLSNLKGTVFVPNGVIMAGLPKNDNAVYINLQDEILTKEDVASVFSDLEFVIERINYTAKEFYMPGIGKGISLPSDDKYFPITDKYLYKYFIEDVNRTEDALIKAIVLSGQKFENE